MVDIEEASDSQIDGHALEMMSREEIIALVRQLPPGYRTVFNLYVIEGYSHQEIGDMLGISSGTSKSQLSRAKGLLKNQLLQLDAKVAESC